MCLPSNVKASAKFFAKKLKYLKKAKKPIFTHTYKK